jgi:hypothetical protein
MLKLSAKILFAEGAFKKKSIRPKFERRTTIDYDFVGFSGSNDVRAYKPDSQQSEINYGMDYQY